MTALSHIRIVLVGTTHPGNIGAVARAMHNMALTRLYLVQPKFFPHEDATARAAGADQVLTDAVLCDSLPAAIADCTLVVGASARPRRIELPPLEPHACAGQILAHAGNGDAALVFGPEHSGLSNAQLDLCQQRVCIPSNPEFASLNLAAAVQVLAYELYRRAGTHQMAAETLSPPATRDEVERLFEHLEQTLKALNFLLPNNPQRSMRRLRALVNRAAPDQNEIQILRGILSATGRAIAAADAKSDP
ncbi:MAG: RNA methyltransferase [Gammaproteobacteria bacterium]